MIRRERKRAAGVCAMLALVASGTLGPLAGRAAAQTEPPAAAVEDTHFAGADAAAAVKAVFPSAARAWEAILPAAFQTARTTRTGSTFVMSRGRNSWFVSRFAADGRKLWEIERPASKETPRFAVSDDGNLVCLFYSEHRQGNNEVLGAAGELLWEELAQGPYHPAPSGRRVLASWPLHLYDQKRARVPLAPGLPPPPHPSDGKWLAGDWFLAHESKRTGAAELFLVDEAAGAVAWTTRMPWPFDSWNALLWGPGTPQMKLFVRAEAPPAEMVEPAIVCLDAAGKRVWQRTGKVAERRPILTLSPDGRELASYKPLEVYESGGGQSLTLLDAATGATRAVAHTIPPGGGGWRGFLSPIGTFDWIGPRRYLVTSADGSDLVPAKSLLAAVSEDGASARIVRFDGFILPFTGDAGVRRAVCGVQGEDRITSWSW